MTVDNPRRLNFQRVNSGIENATATLHLNPRRRWFTEIAKKIKRIEYRDYTPYWRRRIENRKYDFIHYCRRVRRLEVANDGCKLIENCDEFVTSC